jgi:hypothetical protein
MAARAEYRASASGGGNAERGNPVGISSVVQLNPMRMRRRADPVQQRVPSP